MPLSPEDHIEIHHLYALYGHVMDSGDADGWARLFTEDGAWERVEEVGGPVVFSVRGQQQIADFAREDWAARGSGNGRHWMGNIIVEGEGTQATGRTYGFLIQMFGDEIRWVAHGNFNDQLEKTGEGWRFKRRELRLLGDGGIPSEER